jgi:hypothetical protein
MATLKRPGRKAAHGNFSRFAPFRLHMPIEFALNESKRYMSTHVMALIRLASVSDDFARF